MSFTEGMPNLKPEEFDPDRRDDEDDETLLLPGFGDSQLKHFSLSKSFLHIHTSHSHCEVFCFAARLLNKSSATIGAADFDGGDAGDSTKNFNGFYLFKNNKL